MRAGRDELSGKHANTQIPKITGAARSYEVLGEPGDRAFAEGFWNRVVGRHSWVIGGNSDGEHFFLPKTPPDQRDNFSASTASVPRLQGNAATIAKSLRAEKGKPLTFVAEGQAASGARTEVTLRPFTDLYYCYYNVYWNVTQNGNKPGLSQ